MLLSSMISLQIINPGAEDFADLEFSRAPPADAATLPETVEEVASGTVRHCMPDCLPEADVVRDGICIKGTK